MTRKLKYVPIIGTEYRDWTIIDDKVHRKDSNRQTYWKVQCKCGDIQIRVAQHLVNGRTSACKSCCKLTQSFEKSYLKKVKRRSKKINVDFNLDLKYVMSIFNHKCSLSGVPIQFGKHWKLKLSDQTASLDRIDNTKGYIKGNVQWVHKQINFMKGIMSQNTFIEMCNKVTSKCG